jgi:hypothetical protein
MPRRGAPRPRATEVDRADRDSLFAAVLLAVFLHLLLFWGAPSSLVERADSPPPVPQTMELLLEPLPEEPEFEEQYVRAAPNIPEAAPDETRNISDRDQRAAQEESAPPDPENTPFVEGDEPESNRLVQGDPSQEPTPPTPPAASQAGGASPMPRQEAAPAEPVAQAQPDFLEQIPQTDEGPASMETPAEARERPEEPADPRDSVEVTSPADGAGEARFTTPPQSAEAQAPTPRPRPRVERDTSFGPVKDNRQGAIQIGRLAFDAEYSEFGEYWRRVAEIIEARWRNLVYNTRSIPFGGYRVVVRFAITRDGQVTDVEIAHSTAGRLAETVSVDAIVGEAPFFEWTPEMIVKMGDQARCAIHFHY